MQALKGLELGLVDGRAWLPAAHLRKGRRSSPRELFWSSRAPWALASMGEMIHPLSKHRHNESKRGVNIDCWASMKDSSHLQGMGQGSS